MIRRGCLVQAIPEPCNEIERHPGGLVYSKLLEVELEQVRARKLEGASTRKLKMNDIEKKEKRCAYDQRRVYSCTAAREQSVF